MNIQTLLKPVFLAVFLLFGISSVYSQTCTISGSGTINWNNASPPSCVEGGSAGGATVIIIPVGVTLNFDSNPDTWTGTRIEVFGTLRISAPGQVTINSNVVVKNGGLLRIDSKLNLGSTSGCGYTLIVESGGTVDITGGTSDRLNICGVEIARGGVAGCNPYPTGPLPYCEPTGGFTGPTAFDETGYNPSLPVTLLYLTATVADNIVVLNWATEKEEGFDRFIIQRAAENFRFEDIGEVRGTGYDIYSMREYVFTDTQPYSGVNYYRLKAVDLDRSYDYFGPISCVSQVSRKLWVSPNPVSDEGVRFQMNFAPGDGDRVQIIGQDGIFYFEGLVTETNGLITSGRTLKPGIYMLRYISPSFTTVVRFAVVK